MHRGLRILVAAMTVYVAAVPAIAERSGANPKPSMRAAMSVPFIGCASNGQVGPQSAPYGQVKRADVSAFEAHYLAYYRARFGVGTLAPRGWYCFGTYGSSGSTLYVSPTPIDQKALLAVDWKGFTGNVIEVDSIDGGTSGRFGVAAVIARVFPSHMNFVKRVMDEDIEADINPPNQYARGPYPQDKLTYLNNSTVEFVTPADTRGLGTHSGLIPDRQSITGVALLVGAQTDLIQLSMRLPQADRDLSATILHFVERNAAEEDQ